jgi:hypothetical protein
LIGSTTANDNGLFDLLAGGTIKVRFAADPGLASYINNGNNVGIGTATPPSVFSVLRAIGFDPSLTYQSGAFVSLDDSYVELAFGRANASPNYAWIQSRLNTSVAMGLCLNPLGGSVGIGTMNPRTLFTVSGPGGSSPGPPGLGNAPKRFAILSDNNYGLIGGPLDSGDCYLQSQRVDGIATPYNLLLQPSGGNVNIGTTSGYGRLNVAGGNVLIGSGAYNSGAAGDLAVSRESAPTSGVIYFGNANHYIYFDGTNWNFAPALPVTGSGTPGGANTQLQYNASGAFGGIASITYGGGSKLTYSGGSTTTNIGVATAANDIITGSALGDTVISTNVASGNGIVFATASKMMNLSGAGNLSIGYTLPNAGGSLITLAADSAAKPSTNYWQISSDIRLKKNVRPYELGLAAVRTVDPIRFQYNGLADMPTEDSCVGVDAAKMQPTFPESVGSFISKDGTFLHYNPQLLFYAMLNAIKELADRLEKLEGNLTVN